MTEVLGGVLRALNAAQHTFIDRTLPTSGASGGTGGGVNGLNMIFIVAGALGISVLARWLSTRGRRK